MDTRLASRLRALRKRNVQGVVLLVALLAGGLGYAAMRGTDAGNILYYVDCAASANDANDGTSPDKPWRTLTKASQSSLAPGASLLLKRGCTFADQLRITQSGTADKPVYITSYGNGVLPIISPNGEGADISLAGSYITVSDVDLRSSLGRADTSSNRCHGTPIGHTVGLLIEPNASHNTIHDSKMSGHYAGVYIEDNAHDNRVVRNDISDNARMEPLSTDNGNDDAGAFGVLLWGNHNEIAYNTIQNNSSCSYDYVTDGAAVEVYNGSFNTIHHNRGHNNNAFTELGKDPGHASSDNSYSYNVVTSARTTSAFLVTRGSGSDVGPVLRTVAYNNTVFLDAQSDRNSGNQGILCERGCGPDILTARNNIIWASWRSINADAPFNEGNNIYWRSGGQPEMGGFTPSSSSKQVDPRFLDAANGNLHLDAGSPAIDQGASESVAKGFVLDFENRTVPNGSIPDIGAYESHQ